MLISPFSAIFSWEGYEYQGHIALYIALKRIKELLLSDRDLINHTMLEIEGAEDFSIREHGVYKSLHQVKRGAFSLDQNGKKDKFSFIISLLQYESENGFFHVLPSKSLPTDFVQSTVNHIESLLLECNKELKSENEVAKEDFDKYIMLNKLSQVSKKGSLYDILRFVCDGNIERDNVIGSIDKVKDELNHYIIKLRPEGEMLSENNFVLKYDPSFNNSLDVKKSSYQLIAEILIIERPEWSMFIDENYARMVYYKLYIELKALIEQDFINTPDNKTGSQLEFSRILQIVGENHKAESNNVDYQYYLVWESIKDMYEKFPQRSNNHCNVEICNECVDREICNLFEQFDALSKIEKDKLHNFLYRIMLKEPDLNRPNNLPDENLINRLLIELLKEIEILKLGENNTIQARKNGEFYRLTLDSSGEVDELDEQLKRETNSETSDRLLIYESDVLITDQLDKENFIYDSINTNVIGEKEYKELEDISSDSIEKLKKNYNKPKVMRLVNRRTAKEELNDE